MKKNNIIIAVVLVLILIFVGAIIFVKYNKINSNQNTDDIGLIFSYPPSLHSESDKLDYTDGSGQAYQGGIDYNIILSDSSGNPIYFIDAHSDDFSDWLVEKNTYDTWKTRCNEKDDYIIGCKELNINGIPMIMVSEKQEIEGSLIFSNFVIFRNEKSDYKNVMVYLNLPILNNDITSEYDATTINTDLLKKVDEYGKYILAGSYTNFDQQDQKTINDFQNLLKSIKLK